MSAHDSLTERLHREIHQQMEGVLALAERLDRQSLNYDARACIVGVAEAAGSVRQILATHRELEAIATRGVDFKPEPVAMRQIADDLQARWVGKAAATGVTLLVSHDAPPHTVAAIDPRRLTQVFDGFVSQALASVQRGVVEVALQAVPAGDMIAFEGRIRGGRDHGMANRDLDLAEVEGLYGLEIALSVALGRKIVEAGKGQVQTEPNIGAGETVIFRFNLPSAMDPDLPVEDPGSTGRAAHILVVDDNATNRMVAETLCEMFDCTSESAVDGVEAVGLASTRRYDLILMDIKMPRMDGVAATREIRALPGTAGKVPIIALTANADPEDVAAYMAAGMNGIVEKPMKPEALLSALQANLGGEDAVAA